MRQRAKSQRHVPGKSQPGNESLGNLPAGTVGAAYNRTFTANGGSAPYSFSIGAGALPTGLSLNAATGVLSGTPATSGTFSFEVRATDITGCSGSTGYVLTIDCPRITLAPANSNLPNGALGTAYNQSFSASGGIRPSTFEVVLGSLPNGLSLNAATGLLSGSPSARGRFDFVIRVTDGNECTGQRPYRIVVN